jgi:hypothetical protein
MAEIRECVTNFDTNLNLKANKSYFFEFEKKINDDHINKREWKFYQNEMGRQKDVMDDNIKDFEDTFTQLK